MIIIFSQNFISDDTHVKSSLLFVSNQIIKLLLDRLSILNAFDLVFLTIE